MRRPSVTRRVVGDLASLAAVAKAALEGRSAANESPAVKQRVERGAAFIDSLVQWRNDQTEAPRS